MTIDLKTFLLGPTPKNTQLSIEEMDQNFLNLKSGIESVEVNLTASITNGISAEESARIAADNAENAARIAADAALDSRVSVIETSYLKKDGSVVMTGDLRLNNHNIVDIDKLSAKGLNLLSSNVNPDFSVKSDGTFRVIANPNTSPVTLLSVDNSGKVFQNTNAPVTDANQLVTRDYIDRNVTLSTNVVTKNISSTYIQNNKGVSKPFYPPLTSSDFGKTIKYVMSTRGAVSTSLPQISTLGSNRRIKLLNASCDTLAQHGDTFVPGYAINASINIFPYDGDRIVGAALGGAFTPAGFVSLEAGDSAELVAFSNNEWLLVNHSSMGLQSRQGIMPYNGLMFLCRVRANGTIESYTTAEGETRKYLWTRPNSYLGNGSGITVTTSKSSTTLGSYGINWINPNAWGAGNTGILEPMIFTSLNFLDGEPANLSYSIKAQSIDGNSCNIAIKRTDNFNGVDAPFVVGVYGRDV